MAVAKIIDCHHGPTDVPNDDFKKILLERYEDLVFVDDVSEVSCRRCGRVLIHHYVANCGHLFCRNCQRILSEGKRWRCPECKEYVVHIVMNRIGEMTHELKQLKETLDQSQKQTDYQLQILKEADEKQRDDNDFKWTDFQSRINGLRSDLQVETTRLQTSIDDKHDKIAKEINTKWSEMEKIANHNKHKAEEIEQVRQQLLQCQAVIEKQCRDADRMEALEHKMDTLSTLLTDLSESQKQTQEQLIEKFKEMDEKQHRNKETTWNKCKRTINTIITEIRLETTRLQSEINSNHTKIVKELNDKHSKMEETANQHAAELERVKEERQQSHKQTERKFRQVDNKQHNDAEWMRRALDSQSNLLTETSRFQTQIIELCKQKIGELEENAIRLEQQQDEMGHILSKTVDQVGELTMKIQRLTEISGQITVQNAGDLYQSQRLPKNEFGEGTSRTPNMNEGKIRQSKSMPEFLNKQPKTKGYMASNLRINNITYWEETFSYTYNKSIKRPTRYKVPEYNMLLMAESAAEITKFINCFEVLTKYAELDDAISACHPAKPLISTPFKINGREIALTKDEGIAELRQCKCYEYLFKRYLVRFIGTAGYGTTTNDDGQQMTECDGIILRDTRKFIEILHSLHSIVIVMKSTEMELSSDFLHTIKGYLANFSKSRASNLLFIITEVELVRCEVDKVKQSLENILKCIAPTGLERASHNRNFFLIYNEGLRTLIAHNLGAQLSESEMDSGSRAWQMAAEQCQSLVTRAKQLQPWRQEMFSNIFKKKPG